MRYLLSIPMLAIVIAIYVATGPGFSMLFGADLASLSLPSGAVMTFTADHAFILSGLVALFFEMLKAARLAAGTIIDHMLSTAAFVVALVCFLVVDFCGTPTFFLLTVMALIDTVAGYSISIFSARRDYSVSHTGDGGL
jgi:hypothetical protein